MSAKSARHWLTLMLVGAFGPAPAVAAATMDGQGRANRPAATVSVVVRETSAGTDRAERAVQALGGRVGRTLGIIGGFTAEVPIDACTTCAPTGRC